MKQGGEIKGERMRAESLMRKGRAKSSKARQTKKNIVSKGNCDVVQVSRR